MCFYLAGPFVILKVNGLENYFLPLQRQRVKELEQDQERENEIIIDLISAFFFFFSLSWRVAIRGGVSL